MSSAVSRFIEGYLWACRLSNLPGNEGFIALYPCNATVPDTLRVHRVFSRDILLASASLPGIRDWLRPYRRIDR